MRQFDSLDEVDTLTEEEALWIMNRQAAILKGMLDEPYALDDQGDYLWAASHNYRRLLAVYLNGDGTDSFIREEVVKFLKEDPVDWLGTDGDVRFHGLFTERYLDERMG